MKAQKILGLFLLLIFSATPVYAEDLSCPQEEPSKIEALVKGIHQRLKAGNLSAEFCKERVACMTSTKTSNQYTSFLSECSASATVSDIPVSGNCNLDLQERRVLADYMGELYRCINSALYTSNKAAFPTLNRSLNSALKRFPAYEGFVFRGSSLPKAVLDQHQVGQTITYPAYTSTSTDKDIAGDFGTHQFLFYSKSGRPIMGLEAGENEVLFSAGTRFRVLAVKGNKFFLREVTGKETESKAKAEDARILKLAQAAKVKFDPTSKATPDDWTCPLDDKKIPARLVQKTIPDVSEFIE